MTYYNQTDTRTLIYLTTMSKNKTKTIEETYQEQSLYEQIIENPDVQLGSTEMTKHDGVWYMDEENQRMNKSIITYIPGILKLLDEVIVNACDQVVRLRMNDEAKNQVSEIKVEINREEGTLSVYNDGDGIDVVIHKKTDLYVPQMILARLLTSTNYGKDEDGNKVEKITGGKNGYGAKLANIFSEWFKIETVDAYRKKKYTQHCRNNMKDIEVPKIKNTNKKPYTKITFKPDLNYFKMKDFDDDLMKVFVKRVYDITACIGDKVNIYLNGKKLGINSFEKYVGLYIGNKNEQKRAYECVNDRWNVCVCMSPDDKQEHVSFVNSINTLKGGKHVDMIADQVAKEVIKLVKGKKGGEKKYGKLKPQHLKDNMWIFVNSTIVNPKFEGQSKEYLSTTKNKFGSTCKLDDKFIEKVSKCGILEKALKLSDYKSKNSLTKTDGKKNGRIYGIPKLDDAKYAGTKKSSKCTLILTEGDSAKSLAIAGLSVVGSDYFGVFPLKGKLLNVRDVNEKKIEQNAEISNLKKIIGLQQNKVYKDTSNLRYGHIMLFCDADLDGSHIKGLAINLFEHFWPSLLKIDGFITSLPTPIIKAMRKGKKKNEVLSFYTKNEYDNWCQINNENNANTQKTKKWEIKYFKGLGTSSSADAKEYFKNYDKECIKYIQDKSYKDIITMAFDKKKADIRKEWLIKYEPKNVLLATQKEVGYGEFIDKDLIHFSNASNIRSIPSLCDGLKPSQRKIMFSVFKKKLKTPIKVSQFAGYVAEHSEYHHGDASLYQTIISLAQDYVGANNINLLVPDGQFGTRLNGGSDSASPRYIFTNSVELLPVLFNQLDNSLLNHIEEEGMTIEPEWYIPILPLILINGCRGIGTGYSTYVPPHNPLDIITKIYLLMDDEKINDNIMVPWFNKFKGRVISDENGKFRNEGLFTRKGNVIHITELPIGEWTTKYKEFIESKLVIDEDDKKKNKNNEKDEKKAKKIIKPILKRADFKPSDKFVDITLEFENNILGNFKDPETGVFIDEAFKDAFKLIDTKNTSTSNMYLHDRNGKMKKYSNTNEILIEFYEVRLEYYERRRQYYINKLKEELKLISEKVRFIWMVVKNEIIISNRGDDDINKQLIENEFKERENSFEYLIGMPLRSLTEKKISELEKQKANKKKEYKTLKKKTPKELWKDDIEEFKVKYTNSQIDAE